MVIKWCRCNKSSEKYSKYADIGFSNKIASINTADQTAWANNVCNICSDVFSVYYNIFLSLKCKLRYKWLSIAELCHFWIIPIKYAWIYDITYAFVLLYLFW